MAMKKLLALLLVFILLVQIQVPTFADEEKAAESAEETIESVEETDEAVESEVEAVDSAQATADSVEQPAEGVSLEDVKQVEDYKFSFETVAKNSEAELLIDKSVNALRLVSLKTGNYYDTKIMNGQLGNDVIKNLQKSDFSLTYYTDKVRATIETMDSYTKSIKLGQVEYTPIDNGIRCSFTLGDKSAVNLSMFPMFINKERMEQLVLQYLDENQRKELLGKDGYYTEQKERYVRNWAAKKKDGTPTQVAIPKLKRMYNFFYEIGKYNEEELAKDNAEWGQEEASTNITLKVDVEYILDGKDLIVRIPVGNIVTDEKHPVSELTLAPYLLSGDIYDEGYIFVPDGSGGIINFNSGKTFTDVLSIPIYGKNLLNSPYFYTEDFVQSTLPVIGIKKNDTAILGIIEEGAELATVSADVSGKVDEFNKVYAKFDLLYMEKVAMTVKDGGFVVKYAKNGYKGNITMRYKLLEGENANYTGMAKEYKSYLKEKGALKENPVPENAPLFLELLASVPTEKMFLGIPYTSYTSMTSTDEAQKILEMLKADGVENIVLQYTDWANGGMKNSIYKNLKVIRSIGGMKGFKELVSFAKKEGVALFPEIKMLTTYSTWGVRDNRDISRLLDNTKAIMPNFNIVTRQTNKIREWLLSPSFLPKYASSIQKWVKKLEIDGLGLDNSALLLYGDFNTKKELLRTDARPLIEEAFNTLNQDAKLMFSNANSYAFGYASYITDLPTSNSGRRIVDYSVPFVQMVLENDVPYSMEDYNQYSLEGFEKYLLKAIETKSSLKWIMTHENESKLTEAYISKNFNMKPYFQTQFSRWEGKIGDYYDQYNEFYQKVKDAEMKNHEVISSDLVKVEYTNGLTVFINYGKEEKTIDGVKIEPLSYTIKG